jgi:ribosome-associated translation inhibitor RaiA
MDRPLELVFHSMDPSPALESLVRERVERLEHFYPRIVGCRVAIELKNKAHRVGVDLPEIHIELNVPGQMLVVKREPQTRERNSASDTAVAIREAFDTMAVQLKDYKRRQAGDVKSHAPRVAGEEA